MSIEQATESKDLLSQLEQPEVKESLLYLINKLPDIKQTVESIDTAVTFGQSIIEDKDTTKLFEERLSTYPISFETIEACIQLLGKLPMLLKHVEMLEQLTVFIEDVLGDERSLQQIKTSIQELPLVEEGKEAVQLVSEIKERAKIEPKEQVSIFTLMKWLKEPTVQKGLHYVKVALTVLGEKSK